MPSVEDFIKETMRKHIDIPNVCTNRLEGPRPPKEITTLGLTLDSREAIRRSLYIGNDRYDVYLCYDFGIQENNIVCVGIYLSGLWVIDTRIRSHDGRAEVSELVVYDGDTRVDRDPRAILEMFPLPLINLPQYHSVKTEYPIDPVVIRPEDFPSSPSFILDRAAIVKYAAVEFHKAEIIDLPFGEVSALVGLVLTETLNHDYDLHGYYNDAKASYPLVDWMAAADIIAYFKILSHLGITRRPVYLDEDGIDQ